MARVVLAMSGGVDSSVAACLLREQGHDVIGVFMRHGQDHSPATPTTQPNSEGNCGKQGCCTAADADDARRVADQLGIPFYALNFQRDFARIVDYFVDEYTIGRTPNPCIVCNTWLKFGKLFEYADNIGAEYVATGHYARLQRTTDGDVALCRGLDPSKDQSYVLFGIARHLLPRLMFPIGEFHKTEIRQRAEQLGLRVAAKRDSQEICFVPDQDHARFIRGRRSDLDTSGEFVLTDGTVVGHHDGFERFTVGQRKGLGLAFGEPRYVVRIEADTRRVVLGRQEELARDELFAAEANWLVEMGDGIKGGNWKAEGGKSKLQIEKCELEDANCSSDAAPTSPLTTHHSPQAPSPLSPLSSPLSVKIRYRSKPVPAAVEILPGARFRVRFQEPCHGVAPGQAAVCYDGDRVLGGGWIE